MNKVVFGLLAACTLVLMTAPARADFSDSCESAIKGMSGQPEGADAKAAIDKKFGGDVGKMCACMEDKIKNNPQSTTTDKDLSAAEAFAAAVGDILEKGGTGKDVDKMSNDAANQAAGSSFIFSMIACGQP